MLGPAVPSTFQFSPFPFSHAVSTIFGGLHVGSILGLLAAPPLIQAFGWQAVFFVFGGMGLAWAAWYPQFLDGLAAEDTGFEAALNRHPSAGHGWVHGVGCIGAAWAAD